MDNAYFHSWTDIGRLALVGTLAYGCLILFLRVSGNRTLSKMNSFDLVVTVALGSILGSTVLQSNVPFVNGIVAMGLLIGLQFLITFLSVRYSKLASLIKSEPKLLVRSGQLLPGAMRKSRVTEDEIYSSLRKQGLVSLEQVELVVLESNGELQAVAKEKLSS